MLSYQKVPTKEGIENNSSDERVLILIYSCPALLKASENFNTYIQVFFETEIGIDVVEVCKSYRATY
jgi:hypothetical protein